MLTRLPRFVKMFFMARLRSKFLPKRKKSCGHQKQTAVINTKKYKRISEKKWKLKEQCMTYSRKIHQRVIEKMKSRHSPFTSTIYGIHFGSISFILSPVHRRSGYFLMKNTIAPLQCMRPFTPVHASRRSQRFSKISNLGAILKTLTSCLGISLKN